MGPRGGAYFHEDTEVLLVQGGLVPKFNSHCQQYY